MSPALQWISANASAPDAPDVAACVALAYCDRAAAALHAGGSQPAMIPVCEDLEAALALVRRCVGLTNKNFCFLHWPISKICNQLQTVIMSGCVGMLQV
jgi:hypothetical protein